MAEPEGKTIRVYCNDCRQHTKHRVLKTQVQSGSDDDDYYHWKTQYDMLECCGCEDVMLRREYWFSEDPGSTITFFPPRASRWLPKWQNLLPIAITRLLNEIYTALQADSLCIAMMGVRTVIEHSMILKVQDHGSFNENLQALEDAGYVSKTNRRFLKSALDAGSAAAHRAYRPKAADLNTVMDIAENLLHSLFVLEDPVADLEAATPQRPPKKEKSDTKTKPKVPVDNSV